MKHKLFEDKAFYKKLAELTFPIAFQSLMLAAVAAGDAVMLGRVEQNSMAAVSLATQIQFIQNMVVSSMVAGVTVLGAQYWGKGDRRTVGDLFNMGLRLNGLVSLLFFAACVFFPRPLMLLYAEDEALISIGCGYLRIAGWSYLMTGISQCYLGMMKITGHAARSAWISSVTVVGNILLNAVFIFGLLGAPEMGAEGAALATVIARTAELLFLAVILPLAFLLAMAVYSAHFGELLPLMKPRPFTLPQVRAAVLPLSGIAATGYFAGYYDKKKLTGGLLTGGAALGGGDDRFKTE